MNSTLSSAAIELGEVMTRALEGAGGDRLVREIEMAPQTRETRTSELLAPLGVWDLAPRTDPIELEAAAEVCRVAGRFALPYPVAERLSRVDGYDLLFAVDTGRLRADAADLRGRLGGVTADGQLVGLRVLGDRLGSKLGHFVADVELEEHGLGDGANLGSLPLALGSWTLLGMVERAVELTIDHVREREQFGRRLADFQGLQFQLTDAAVAVQGLGEHARFSLWSQRADPDNALVDALALRLAALDAANVVFKITHQLHGATGFCDEHHLSWLSRYSQPLRRLPFGVAETEIALLDAVEESGFSGLFTPDDAAYAVRPLS